MKRHEVLKILREQSETLQTRFGVTYLALFGSVAREESSGTSDIDLLVQFDRPVGLFHIFHLQDYLERCLGGRKVDLGLRESVIDELQEIIYGEAIDVVG
jgi:predicted nucleotidyltransferase